MKIDVNLDAVILIIVLTGLVIGLVNSTEIWGTGYLEPQTGDYELTGFEDIGGNGIWDQFYIYVVFAQTAWNMASTALQMLVFAYPLLLQIGCPMQIAVVIQGCIWVITLFWAIEFIQRIR